MRPWLSALLLNLLSLTSQRLVGQGLIWENRIGWMGPDRLTDVIATDSGKYVACGTRYSYGHLYGMFDWEPDICLVKFDSQGDTLWMKSIGSDGISPHLCLGDSNTFYIVFSAPFFPNADVLNVYHVDFDGNILDRWTVPGSVGDPTCYRMIRTQDGSLLIVGSWTSPQGSGRTVDMFVLRMEPTQGFIWFFNRYTDHAYTLGGWIEETQNRTYLASGSAGSHIWAIEIDSSGNEVRRQTFYETPTQAILDETSAVQQAPNGGYVVSGKPVSFSPPFYYLGYFSSFSPSNRLWGGENSTFGLPPRVQADGSTFTFTNRSSLPYLSRLRGDSSVVWDVLLQSQFSTSITNCPLIKALAYVGDSTAICVGTMNQPGSGSFGDQFYFCRIQGVGLPYNPGQPVGVKKPTALPPLIAYPTPATTILIVHTRAKEPLQLINLSGQVVLTAKPDQGGTTQIDVAALPPSMYLLRQGQANVKVIKE